MLISLLLTTFATLRLAESTVLDPALFLSPSPPLTLTSDDITPGELWLQPLEARMERIARDAANQREATTEEPTAESGRMLWPGLRAGGGGSVGISFPLTFSMSGSYGTPLRASSGAVGSTYTSVAAAGVYGNYGRSALAGSSYGAPGVRVYGGDSAASWSGWGNGKWGHYGKG